MIAGIESHEVSWYRPTTSRQALGDSTRSWGTALKTGMPVTVQHDTANRKQEEAGVSQDALYVVTVDQSYDVQPGDGLVVTAGPFAVGEKMLVLDRRFATRVGAVQLKAQHTNDGP